MTRTQILMRISVVFAVALLAISCAAPGANDSSGTAPSMTPPADTAAADEIKFLFVQSAGASSLEGGVLRLTGVNPATIFFSDRPDRIAGHVPTEQFVIDWGEGDDSFAANPPNATLSILAGAEPQEIVLVLTSPRLDGGDLLYDVEVLEGNESAAGGASSLFIDIIGRPLTPMSFAGMTRRVARRTARRTSRRH